LAGSQQKIRKLKVAKEEDDKIALLQTDIPQEFVLKEVMETEAAKEIRRLERELSQTISRVDELEYAEVSKEMEGKSGLDAYLPQSESIEIMPLPPIEMNVDATRAHSLMANFNAGLVNIQARREALRKQAQRNL